MIISIIVIREEKDAELSLTANFEKFIEKKCAMANVP